MGIEAAEKGSAHQFLPHLLSYVPTIDQVLLAQPKVYHIRSLIWRFQHEVSWLDIPIKITLCVNFLNQPESLVHNR